jgi:hypothetical protein
MNGAGRVLETDAAKEQAENVGRNATSRENPRPAFRYVPQNQPDPATADGGRQVHCCAGSVHRWWKSVAGCRGDSYCADGTRQAEEAAEKSHDREDHPLGQEMVGYSATAIASLWMRIPGRALIDHALGHAVAADD